MMSKMRQNQFETGIALIFSITLFFAFSSCLRNKDFDEVPIISYHSYFQEGDIGKLKISFTDGDGDIGLSQGDTVEPYDITSLYYHNLFVEYFEKRNGNYELLVFPDDSLNNYFRVPVITPEGQNKSLEGDIEIDIFLDLLTPYDTVMFEVFLVDRALHHSNTIQTPDLVLVK